MKTDICGIYCEESCPSKRVRYFWKASLWWRMNMDCFTENGGGA